MIVALALLSLAIWTYLLLGRDFFWLARPVLPPPEAIPLGGWPAVDVVIPARNEAKMLAQTLRPHDYGGPLRVIVVDDGSDDGTADAARARGAEVVAARPTPPGWAPKVWAMAEGLRAGRAPWVLFTDADIRHAPDSIARLVAHAGDRDLISVMAKLRIETAWDRLLIPAFTYFFMKLYPFERAEAAAGGCMLVRRECVDLERIRGALIDDVALAGTVERRWLGFSDGVESLRRYGTLGATWEMVARTAFVQLRRSWALTGLAALGMLVTYAIPFAWPWAALSYVPTLRRCGVSAWWAPALPAAALLYTLMTIDSARRGEVRWRGRAISLEAGRDSPL